MKEVHKSTLTLKPVVTKEKKFLFLSFLFTHDEKCMGRIFKIPENSFIFGRQPEIEGAIKINDPKVSRVHGKIIINESCNIIKIIDLESKNGIFVNGEKRRSSLLKSQDIIRTGDTIWTILEVESEFPFSIPEDSPIIAKSFSMRKIYQDILKFSFSDFTCLIEGESGTGKDLVAEEIHRLSQKKGKFLAINCSAIPEDLFEGYFLDANEGTLFLDKIEELKPNAQKKLLRFLETKEIKSVPVNVRVLSATNKNIDKEVQEGRFHPELFAKLSKLFIKLPPLRERKEDIIPIVESIISKEKFLVSPDFAEISLLYDWQDNVQELITEVNNACARAKGKILDADLLPEKMRGRVQKLLLSGEIRTTKIPTKEELRITLQKFKGRISDVARFFGKDRRQIYRWIEYYGINMSKFRNFTETIADEKLKI